MSMDDPRSRVESRITHDENGCWIWTATLRPDGYGVIWNGKGLTRAHRYSYEAFIGPIPKGLVLYHLCRVRSCVNPAHLEPVTHRENTLRGVSPVADRAKQTHCIHGHEFVGDNVYIHPQRGTRNCRACLNQAARDRRAGKAGTGPCSDPECDRPASSRGMCPTHYARWRKASRRLA